MAPTSGMSNSGNGILGSLFLVCGLAVVKAAGIDYKTLLKICITIVTLMAGWGVNHLINCMDRIDASQIAIVRSVGSIETKIAVSDQQNSYQYQALKKCLDDHITEYQKGINRNGN